jgi:hypothetical protein
VSQVTLTSLLLLSSALLVHSGVALAQAPDKPSAPVRDETTEQWEPLGPIPVDQAGSGRRGYTLAGEGTQVAGPGEGRLSLHSVAANNSYQEQTADFFVSQRYETHTLALGYRRGFDAGPFRRLEIGGQVQVGESDGGFLNGFISGVENLWASVSGNDAARNPLRKSGVYVPLGTIVAKRGAAIYRTSGQGRGFGDFQFVAKALLRDDGPAARGARVAARAVVNLAGDADLTEGNFAGIGVSVDDKVSERIALHGDLRGTLALDSVSPWGVPLKRGSIGFSVGPELRLTRNTSLNLQYDGSSTPYVRTGTKAFDGGYGAASLGVGHRFRRGERDVLLQFYARENLDLPFWIRWNMDPDFAIGLKASVSRTHRR